VVAQTVEGSLEGVEEGKKGLHLGFEAHREKRRRRGTSKEFTGP